jgi:GNAT superfamily N-acetyltransferase
VLLDGRALFEAGPLRAVELGAGDVAALQRFFEANPAYHVAVNGQPPPADLALSELRDQPPPEIAFGRRWLLGFVDEAGELVGMATIVSDFVAERVWLIGLFVVASSLHGTGTSQALYGGLESWVRDKGGGWMRLGVVVGNARAERFWHRLGYRDVRRRDGVAMGLRVNSLRIMVKALAGGELAEYLALVARDRPGEP